MTNGIKTGTERRAGVKMIYAAYGSNLDVKQMVGRCADAQRIGLGRARGWQLEFNGVADIRQRQGASVPLGLWAISEDDLRALDSYEGYPRLYTRVNVATVIKSDDIPTKHARKILARFGRSKADGSIVVSAMVYIMTDRDGLASPCDSYRATIERGYADFGIADKMPLVEAVARADKADARREALAQQQQEEESQDDGWFGQSAFFGSEYIPAKYRVNGNS